MPCVLARAGLAALLTGLALPGPVLGQPTTGLGTRALGMAGAFTAIADDASAVYWNPAGMATGAYGSLVVDWLTHESGAADDDRGAPAVRGSGTLVAATTPVLGVGYYRVRQVALGPVRGQPAGSGGLVEAARDGQALVSDHFAVSLAQTLVERVHVGAALKAVRGRAAAGRLAGADLALDTDRQLDALEEQLGDGSTAFDADVGVMVDARRVRFAVMARNLLEPSFATPTPGLEMGLQRQVRAGAALLPSDRVVVGVDADLATVDTVAGRWREVAVGAEVWTPSRRLGVRGGLRVQTVDEARPRASAGGSAVVWKAINVDVEVTRGADAAWAASLGGRVAF